MAVIYSDVLRGEGSETGIHTAGRNQQTMYATDTRKIIHKYQDGSVEKYIPESLMVAYGQTGVAGQPGSTGLGGEPGTTGAQGHTGAEGTGGGLGTTGLMGPTGSQGETGAQGHTGAQGLTGLQGSQGVTGLVGMTGAQGHTGAQGSQGSQGVTGLVGMTGAQGLTGLHGSQGVTGLIGLTGAQGSQGVTGPNADTNNGFAHITSVSVGETISGVTGATWYTVDETDSALVSNFALDALGSGAVHCDQTGYYKVSYHVLLATDYASKSYVSTRIKHVSSGPTTTYRGPCEVTPGNDVNTAIAIGSFICLITDGDELFLEIGNTLDLSISTIYYYDLSWTITPVRRIF